MPLTMGNFFSGSGTWELAAKLCGIEVKWESEIEPFPVALEAKRFPEAEQLGDIKDVDGYLIEPVDIMTNSSPCQDLSIAGKRAGLEAGSGTRSSLFHEVIRITKEMKDATDGEYPRLWCWENVPGAFSSNNGEDFRSVLEEIARIVEPDAVIPLPPKGKWSNAGMVEGDGWQIAWRVLDAQYAGVAQRRRRVYLVGDLGGHCAGEILFERESMPGHFKKITETWEGSAGSLEDRIRAARGYILRGDRTGDRT